MSVEEKQKVKTSQRIYKYFAIASFVLGLFSFMMMLCLVFQFLNVDDNLLLGIVTIMLLLSLPCSILALILGILAYCKMTYKEHRLSKILTLCGIVLSLFYWVLFSLRHTEWAGGYLA